MPSSNVRTLTLPSGQEVPILGQGTWNMGENRSRHSDEVSALKLGLDLGMVLIDTAEMYASGGAEMVVAEAMKGRRNEVFVVDKVLPSHASRKGTITACENSLRRLKTEHIDLYLLHWRGSIPLRETIEAFTALVEQQKIRYWGVSNFDLSDMQELFSLAHGKEVATNQVLYNLTRRGIEYDLLPWCREQKLPIMAYSPIEQGRLLNHPVLQDIAKEHHATPAQIALAWMLQQSGVMVIPKSGSQTHVKENWATLDLQLTEQDNALLDKTFPAPTKPQSLEML